MTNIIAVRKTKAKEIKIDNITFAGMKKILGRYVRTITHNGTITFESMKDTLEVNETYFEKMRTEYGL